MVQIEPLGNHDRARVANEHNTYARKESQAELDGEILRMKFDGLANIRKPVVNPVCLPCVRRAKITAKSMTESAFSKKTSSVIWKWDVM